MIQRRLALAWDLETTGLRTTDRIVQVGFAYVCVDTGDRLHSASVTINPGIPIPRGAVEVHQLSDEEVDKAPPLEEAWPFIARHLTGAWARENSHRLIALVTHNGTEFDRPFLVREASRIGERIWTHAPHADTFIASWGLDPGAQRRLGLVAQRHGISILKAHSAAEDAEATARVYVKMCQRAGGVEQLKRVELSAARSLDLYGRTLLERSDGQLVWIPKPHTGSPLCDLPRPIIERCIARRPSAAVIEALNVELSRRDGGRRVPPPIERAELTPMATFEEVALSACGAYSIDPCGPRVEWGVAQGSRVRVAVNLPGVSIRWRPVTSARGRPLGEVSINGRVSVGTAAELFDEVMSCAA